MTINKKEQVASLRFLVLAVVMGLSLGACKQVPSTIQKGVTVKMNYSLTVDGKVVDSSVSREPLAYVAGSGQIIPGLDEQLMGLKIGDKKNVVVPPEKGYGLLNPKAIQIVPKKMFMDQKMIQLGAVVRSQQNGHPMQAKIIKIGKNDVTMDLNHPLAGKTLNFDVEIVGLEKTKESTTK